MLLSIKHAKLILEILEEYVDSNQRDGVETSKSIFELIKQLEMFTGIKAAIAIRW